MTVDHLIEILKEISDNGGGQSVLNIHSLVYWDDDLVTVNFGSEIFPMNPEMGSPIIYK